MLDRLVMVGYGICRKMVVIYVHLCLHNGCKSSHKDYHFNNYLQINLPNIKTYIT